MINESYDKQKIKINKREVFSSQDHTIRRIMAFKKLFQSFSFEEVVLQSNSEVCTRELGHDLKSKNLTSFSVICRWRMER